MKAMADLIDAAGGTSDRSGIDEVITLSLAQAASDEPASLLPYEVLLIRLGKYVASQVPAAVYRDRIRRSDIRRQISERLLEQGLDASGARIRA
jgi:hypothetical protein